jgi:hypothetical protein
MANRYHVQDDGEMQVAVAAYFEEHPELNPERVSVELAVDPDWVPNETPKYRAVGHLVVPAPPGYAAGTPEQTADIPLEELAKVAFDAYAAQLSHANHTMDVAEGWRNQGAEVKDGFAAAAHAVQDRVLGRPLLDAPTLARPDEGH